NGLLGAVGLGNDVWDAATKWFDHYLNGVDNGIDQTPPVQFACPLDQLGGATGSSRIGGRGNRHPTMRSQMVKEQSPPLVDSARFIRVRRDLDGQSVSLSYG
ncbi:hypothetical protein ACFQ1S_28975, partial [Kibdelosporangium lantanae]